MAIYSDLAKLGRVKLPTGTTYALIDVDGRAIIAPNFSSSGDYYFGDYVIGKDLTGDNAQYNDCLLRAIATPSSTFNPDQWQVVTVSSEIRRLENKIIGGIHYRGKTTSPLYEGSTLNPITISGDSYTVEAGDLVQLDLASVASNYQSGVAILQHSYIKNGGIYYVATVAITAAQNTSFAAIADKLNVVKSNPEFLFDGTIWNEMGSIAEGLGDLAFKDSASGTYVKPTGLGSVTVKEFSQQSLGKLDQISIVPTNGTESVSKMTAGTAKDIAKAGTAVVYGTANVGAAVTYGTANRAAEATRYGTANVGTAVTYGTADVGAEATIGNANVGTAVTVATAGTEVVYGKADVGAEVTYGTANPGTAVTGIAKVGTQKTFTVEGIKVAPTDGDCLTFSLAGTDNIYGVQSSGVSITPAVASTTKLTPAVAAPSTQKIRPVGGTTSITPAVTSTTKIHGAVASDKTLTPAVAAPSTQTIYGAVTSTSTLTPAVAAPSTQTIVPAVENGTITPWTESAKTVAKVAGSAVTVATGTTSNQGTGTPVVLNVAFADATKVVSVGTTSDTVTVK